MIFVNNKKKNFQVKKVVVCYKTNEISEFAVLLVAAEQKKDPKFVVLH